MLLLKTKHKLEKFIKFEVKLLNACLNHLRHWSVWIQSSLWCRSLCLSCCMGLSWISFYQLEDQIGGPSSSFCPSSSYSGRVRTRGSRNAPPVTDSRGRSRGQVVSQSQRESEDLFIKTEPVCDGRASESTPASCFSRQSLRFSGSPALLRQNPEADLRWRRRRILQRSERSEPTSRSSQSGLQPRDQSQQVRFRYGTAPQNQNWTCNVCTVHYNSARTKSSAHLDEIYWKIIHKNFIY